MSKSIPTARQLEIVDLISKGLSYRQIADRLGIKKKTAYNHAYYACCRLGLGNKPQVDLAVWHYKQRIAQLEAQLAYSKTFPRHD